MSVPDLLVILGPTASGKTRLGVAAARLVQGEIISADSRQVYRGMDLGTGKDLAEYGPIPHHLIDIAAPGAAFSVFDFQRRAWEAIGAIRRRERRPVLVGGSGLYLAALLQGYRLVEVPEDPLLRAELAALELEELRARLLRLRPRQHNSSDLLERERLVRAIEIAEGEAAAAALPPPPRFIPLVCGLRWPRELLRQRITLRLKERFAAGMIEEVARLHASGIPWETLDYYGLEYRFIARHLQGRLNRNDLFQQLNSAIHQFAKRQETWFRRMERQGVAIHWLDGDREPLAALARLLEAHGLLRERP